MIVEFIGPTGAGKTTLISAVHAGLADRTDAVISYDVVAAVPRLRQVTNPTVRNLVQEIAAFPHFIRSLYHHRTFLAFALRMLARHRKLSFRTISYLRSLERTIGAYELLRYRTRSQIVLVDEGTIVPAHGLFVFTNAHYSADEVMTFAELAPLPDAVVYVRAPIDALVRRTLKRADPPRELQDETPAAIEAYLLRATSMFETLTAAEVLRERTLIVDNLACAQSKPSDTADSIVQFLVNRLDDPTNEGRASVIQKNSKAFA